MKDLFSVSGWTGVLSKQIDQESVDRAWKVLPLRCWKVAGALVQPQSIVRNSKDPRQVQRDVLHGSCSGWIWVVFAGYGWYLELSGCCIVTV